MHSKYNYMLAIPVTLKPVLYNKEAWHFSQEIGAATKEFEFCQFRFQMAFVALNAFCMFWNSIFVWNKLITFFVGSISSFRV